MFVMSAHRAKRIVRPRRWFPVLAVAVLLGGWAAASASQASPATVDQPAVAAAPRADSGTEQQFVNAINQLRASKGLRQLQVSGELTGVARGWTDQMVRNGQISHNPNLGSQVSGNWTKLGENVGVGYDVNGLMQAFINSPAHYRNLVDPDWIQTLLTWRYRPLVRDGKAVPFCSDVPLSLTVK